MEEKTPSEGVPSLFFPPEQEPIDWKTVYFKYNHDMTKADLSEGLHIFWHKAAAAAKSTEKTAQAVRASSKERPARAGVVRGPFGKKRKHFVISGDSEVKADSTRSKASKTLKF